MPEQLEESNQPADRRREVRRTASIWRLLPVRLPRLAALLTAAPISLITAVACSTGDPALEDEAERTPTYHRDVAPIIQRSCAKCHYEGELAPFALTEYAKVRALAPAINAAVQARIMPPWGAQTTKECEPPFPWRDDERLSEEEILTLKRWEEAGAPEGDPADAPPPIMPVKQLELPEPTLELAPREPYTPEGNSADEFRCFVLEAPELEEGGFVSAVNIIPGNRKTVHHATLFTDIEGRAAKRAGPDGSFDCPPGFSVGQSVDGSDPPMLAWLYAWAPGAKPLDLPSNLGIRINPKSKVIMEVHYSTGGRQVAPDLTRVQLTLAKERPEYSLMSWGVGNQGRQTDTGDGLQPGPGDRDGVAEFRIPVNARDHVEVIQTPSFSENPLPIFGLRPHAHLAAVDIKLDVVRDGQEQCFVQDRWDFHWQRVYTYDAPIEQLPTVNPGDKVRIRCTYDNSMKNRRLAQELWERGLPPMDIFLGDETLDEMCLVELLFVVKTW